MFDVAKYWNEQVYPDGWYEKSHARELTWTERRIRDLFPPEYATADIRTMVPLCAEQTAVIETCRAWAEAFPNPPSVGVLFSGGVGTGKTHIAYGILRAALEKGVNPQAVTLTGLFRRIREGYSKNEPESVVLEPLLKTRLLLLDDFGAEIAKDWNMGILFELVNERYVQRLPTLFTTNKTAEELRSRIMGKEQTADVDAVTFQRIYDRVRQMAGNHVFCFGDTSLRGAHHA